MSYVIRTTNSNWPWWSRRDWTVPHWDDGVRWYTSVVAPPLEPTLTVQFVRDDHLKLTNGTIEDAYIARLIRVTTRMAERVTARALMPQTRELVMDRFPSGLIEVPWPPLIEVESIEYVDSGGNEVTVDPSAYQVSTPRGPTCKKGVIMPATAGSWPDTSSDAPEPVRIAFRCGYVDEGSPEQANVPEDIIHGQLLVIGELYKTRSESIIGAFGTTVNPAIISARNIWREYRAH